MSLKKLLTTVHLAAVASLLICVVTKGVGRHARVLDLTSVNPMLTDTKHARVQPVRRPSQRYPTPLAKQYRMQGGKGGPKEAGVEPDPVAGIFLPSRGLLGRRSPLPLPSSWGGTPTPQRTLPVKKLQLELENINKLHKETIFSYKNEIEMARATEEKLLKELEAMKLVADEAVTMQKEIDIRCQHKIAEMVALMEKHKRQYDKTVEEKDTELEYFKTKEKELSSAIELLQTELSCKKNELSSLQDQLKIEIEEKKAQTSTLETPKHSLNSQPLHAPQNSKSTNVNKLEYTQKPSWTPAKIYTVKTPPKSKLQRENTNQCPENRRKKKRRVLLEMDTRSDSSENDILVHI
nr:PREDICTED: synaptonemal complex protein 1 [Anolis carolinensis]|eukprot:XP_016848488.1 PREDICTED: synaptonemal complex protein 1 [Anolis carolinensis]